MDKIDFVMLWVDGADPAWLKEKQKYDPTKKDYSSDSYRFRSFDNLQYWFRGVEQFAPWVNNIYFITWGHVPAWLNTQHPKLKVINHKDYIPEEYLPTFNSNVIELNLHRIKDLSDTFVLFNDDTFIIKDVKPEDFFVNALPKDQMIESPIKAAGKKYRIAHTMVNNMNIINDHFNKRSVIKKHCAKIYTIKYGKKLLSSIYQIPVRYFVGFMNPHLVQPHLKHTFEKLWEMEPEAMHETSMNKFRGLNDVSHWLMRYWNLCSGAFVPQKEKIGAFYMVTGKNDAVCKYIKNQKGKVVCINDVMSTKEDALIGSFDDVKNEINAALDSIMPNKSSFEL